MDCFLQVLIQLQIVRCKVKNKFRLTSFYKQKKLCILSKTIKITYFIERHL